MDKKILEKLKGYSLSAGALVFGTTASAQINYTDLNPDVTVTGSGSYALDLNNDNTVDFNITVSNSSYSYGGYNSAFAQVIISASGSNSVLANNSYSAYALNSGSNINNNAGGWISYAGLAGVFTYSYGSLTSTGLYGQWPGQTDKYLGLRLQISGQTYYGWARLDVSSGADQFTIKDYAIETTAGATIQAGDTGTPMAPADIASNVMASDVANNGNGLDLEVSFDKAQDETTVGEYRIMVVKEANAATFNLIAAQAVVSNNYTSVLPTGSNISTVLANNSRDVSGAFIVEGQPYRVFVLSMADGVNAQSNALSSQSNSVTLTSPANTPPDPATNLMALDVSDNANGSDIEVTFDAGLDESKIGTYELIAVKTANAASFTVQDAMAVPASGKTSVPVSGLNSYTVLLGASQNDSDGDPIAVGVPYKIIIQSVADGMNAIVDTISMPSNEVTLDDPLSVNEIDESILQVYFDGVSIQIKAENPIGEVVVTDLNGKTVHQTSFAQPQASIATSQMAKGIYFVRINSAKTTEIKKLVIH